ncbi:hypothetical protein AB0F11_34055 [Streptomyces sp. NPDC032472]|uniref:hypothetical protein n=1 Tax=Streptomyces sp. NPDC032472 TaxID=3155018 RepID=UPI0033FD89FE
MTLRSLARGASLTAAVLLLAAPAATTVHAAEAPASAAPTAAPCVGIGKLGTQSVLSLLNIGLQDLPIITSQQEQQCPDNSAVNAGDEPLSHILDGTPVTSGTGDS